MHCYFNGSLFCSVVAGGTSHFYSFFSGKILARVDFLVWQLWPLALASQAQAKNRFGSDGDSYLQPSICKVPTVPLHYIDWRNAINLKLYKLTDWMFHDTLRFHLSQSNDSVYLHTDYPNWTVTLLTKMAKPFRVVLGWAYRGLTGGFLLPQNFSVAISVSPHVCFILVLILISVFLR